MSLQGDDAFNLVELCNNNFSCPLCFELLLDPVLAADGIAYNKHCIDTYMHKFKNNATIMSPLKIVPISRVTKPLPGIRYIIINLIKETNLFDDTILSMDIYSDVFLN